MGKNKGRIVKTRFKGKDDKFILVAQGFVFYREMALAAMARLRAKRKDYNENIQIRLLVEANFCISALLKIFKVSRSFIEETKKRIHSNPKRFEEDLERFCKSVDPKENKLITDNLDEELKKLLNLQQKHKKIQEGGNILIR